MTSRHTLTRADEVYVGDAKHYGYKRNKAGILFPHFYAHDYGAIAAKITKGLVNDATSTELPNAASKTYTPATDGTSPLDSSTRLGTTTIHVNGVDVLVWDLGNPGRNVSSTTTHATSIVAMTILVSGYDIYNTPMSELLTVTATGTSKTVAGAKAFRYISSVVITSAGNATTNTLAMAGGDVVGVPFAIATKSSVFISTCDGAVDAVTIVPAVTSTATTTTGDTRGTVVFTTTPDGTKRFALGFLVDHTSAAAAFGVTQA